MAQMSLQRRITIILYILSFTISLFIFSVLMNRVSINIECTSYSQYVVDGSDIYYGQNIKGQGILFKMNSKGNVSHMFSSKSLGDTRIIGLSVYEGNVYAVLSGFAEVKNAKSTDEDAIVSVPTYRIIKLDTKLNLLSTTNKFATQEEEVLGGFSAEGTGLFMTLLAKDGSYVKVNCIAYDELRDPDATNDDNVKAEMVRSKTASNGRFYSDALYKEGQLYLRSDADEPTGVFKVDSYIKSLVTDMKLTVGQLFTLYSTYIIWYIACLLIWFILLYWIIRVFENRDRSFYYLLIAEGLLLVITIGGVITIAEHYFNSRATEHSRFASISLIGLADEAGLSGNTDYSDSSFYDSETYMEAKNVMCEFARREGNNDIFYDVFVYRLRDNMICMSSSGRNRQSGPDVYGQDIANIPTKIFKGQKYTAQDLTIEGQDYRAVAITEGVTVPEYALVGIINSTTTDGSVFVDNRAVFLLFVLVFALASALVVIVWRFHMADLAVLEDALSITALGGELPNRPVTLGRDVKDMWDSITEIHKRIDEIEYIKLRTLEVYYRFAPKNVERLLGKNSIMEVEGSVQTHLYGTVAVVSLDLEFGQKLKRVDTVIDSIGEFQKDHQCIVVGKVPDLSGFQMLFGDQEKDTVRFFTDLFNRNIKTTDKSIITTVLYQDECDFGVMGNEDEATTYLHSNDQDLIQRISKFVTDKKLGLIITGRVRESENVQGPLRFIGYAGQAVTGENVKLYEVLDAYPARTRSERLQTLQRYNEALDAFYEKDFYIARTKFSELLKDTPDDNLIKWYVFESDRFLNEFVEDDSYKILHL